MLVNLAIYAKRNADYSRQNTFLGNHITSLKNIQNKIKKQINLLYLKYIISTGMYKKINLEKNIVIIRCDAIIEKNLQERNSDINS